MQPEHKPAPGREDFAALSPTHATFAERGGYDLLRSLHTLTDEMGLSYAVAVQLGGELHACGRIGEDAAVEIQACALAANGRLEDLCSGLAAYLGVPVGFDGADGAAPAEGG